MSGIQYNNTKQSHIDSAGDIIDDEMHMTEIKQKWERSEAMGVLNEASVKSVEQLTRPWGNLEVKRKKCGGKKIESRKPSLHDDEWPSAGKRPDFTS